MKIKIRNIVQNSKKVISLFTVHHTSLEIEILMSFAFKKDRLWYHRNFDTEFSISYAWFPLLKFIYYLYKYLNAEPIAYILGKKEFYGRDFFVSRATLIPRPESEGLIDLAIGAFAELELFKGQNNLNVLDLCCGSGCIGLTLYLEKPSIQLDLADLSLAALRMTKKNLNALLPEKQTCNLYHSYLFENLPQKKYHLILCNPPYVLPIEFPSLEKKVRKYEPRMALVCEDPRKFYTSLFKGFVTFIEDEGVGFIEISPSLLELCIDLATEFNLKLTIKKDIQQKERYLILRKNR